MDLKAIYSKGKLSMQRKKPEYRENLINATLIIEKDPFSWVILKEKGGHATPICQKLPCCIREPAISKGCVDR